MNHDAQTTTTKGRQRIALSQSRDAGMLDGELECNSASSSDALTQEQRAHALPHSLVSSVRLDDVTYTGYLFPESAHIITMSEEAFNALLADAKKRDGDVTCASEYRKEYV